MIDLEVRNRCGYQVKGSNYPNMHFCVLMYEVIDCITEGKLTAGELAVMTIGIVRSIINKHESKSTENKNDKINDDSNFNDGDDRAVDILQDDWPDITWDDLCVAGIHDDKTTMCDSV